MKMLGILGGLGPLASAELLDTVYKLNLNGPEQEAPRCVLYSDPSFPDRTQAILRADTGELTECLARGLAALRTLGAERMVIACVTIHHILPDIAADLREPVISLIDLTIDEILRDPRPLLLLCTSGTRTARIFESHPRWNLVADRVNYLDEEDQIILHNWIYRIKANEPLTDCLSWLEALPVRYGRQGFVFGCTELHILHKELQRRHGRFDPRAVDPLLIVARDLRRLML
ncbi:MAG TPA: aspartate/glutamate racemase family protein [Thermoanaerobaculia bacterium]|nr:aspartate/glutamate racemase family protein [Thermoanaerobaculia bacterium]